MDRKTQSITVHKNETEMFEGMAFEEKDPRRSLHID
jgi:crotonyl-CoA reductase